VRLEFTNYRQGYYYSPHSTFHITVMASMSYKSGLNLMMETYVYDSTAFLHH